MLEVWGLLVLAAVDCPNGAAAVGVDALAPKSDDVPADGAPNTEVDIGAAQSRKVMIAPLK